MATGIAQSVGKGGVNRPADVKLVQQLLSPYATRAGLPALVADGTAGKATVDAINLFQGGEMRFPAPDGLLVPGGKTMVGLLARSPAMPRLTYAGVDRAAQIVDDYSFAVIRFALVMAGMKAAVITSTLRPPQEQAAAMYKNAAQDLGAQYALYGALGDEILQVYSANRTKPADTVIDLMRRRIEAQLADGHQVSRHVSTPARYAKLNVLDIGLNSTRNAAGDSFDHEALTRAFTKLSRDGFIDTFIDETAKSNCCWHLEIVPGAKKI